MILQLLLLYPIQQQEKEMPEPLLPGGLQMWAKLLVNTECPYFKKLLQKIHKVSFEQKFLMC